MSLAVGMLGRTSSQRSEAFRAASNLVQVSQENKTKHGRSRVARESNADDFEMEKGVVGRALMRVRSVVEGGVEEGGRSDRVASTGLGCAPRT